MKNLRKLLVRKIEMGHEELHRRCTAAYELFAAETNLKIKRSLPAALKARDYGEFLQRLQDGLDCDPFMERSQLYSLMLEAWSSRYDLSRLDVELQRHEIEVLAANFRIPTHVMNEATDRLQVLEKVSAEHNARFAYCRVVNHIDQGTFRPPATVAEQRKHLSRSFLALSCDTSTLECVKEARGPEELQKVLVEKKSPNQVGMHEHARVYTCSVCSIHVHVPVHVCMCHHSITYGSHPLLSVLLLCLSHRNSFSYTRYCSTVLSG